MTASSTTLHQMSRAANTWSDDFLRPIQAIWQTNDVLILLGEAAQGYQDQRLKPFYPIYMLQSDADVLGISTPFLDNSHSMIDLSIINYEQWASLILSYNKHITWA